MLFEFSKKRWMDDAQTHIWTHVIHCFGLVMGIMLWSHNLKYVFITGLLVPITSPECVHSMTQNMYGWHQDVFGAHQDTSWMGKRAVRGKKKKEAVLLLLVAIYP
jgi:hypothetical protein